MRKSELAISRCKTISIVQKLLGGKYKIELLWYIGKCDVRRFGQLRRQIGEITESSLTKQLRELETDGFILRHDFCEVPPRVEYTLTELGESFLSVLDCIVAQNVQAFWKSIMLFLLFVALELQLRKQAIPRECFIQRMQQLTVLRIAQQRVQRRIDTSYHI